MLDLKGLWIPSEILFNKELIDTEKFVLALIICLNKNGNGCYCKNQTISELFRKSKRQTIRIINSLEKKGYITKKIIYEENSYIVKSRILVPTKKIDSDMYDTSGDTDDTRGSDINVNTSGDMDVTYNKTNNKIINNKNKDFSPPYKKAFAEERFHSPEFLESLYDN